METKELSRSLESSWKNLNLSKPITDNETERHPTYVKTILVRQRRWWSPWLNPRIIVVTKGQTKVRLNEDSGGVVSGPTPLDFLKGKRVPVSVRQRRDRSWRRTMVSGSLHVSKSFLECRLQESPRHDGRPSTKPLTTPGVFLTPRDYRTLPTYGP